MVYHFCCLDENDESMGEIMRTDVDRYGGYLTVSRLEDSVIQIGRNWYEYVRHIYINKKDTNVLISPIKIDRVKEKDKLNRICL